MAFLWAKQEKTGKVKDKEEDSVAKDPVILAGPRSGLSAKLGGRKPLKISLFQDLGFTTTANTDYTSVASLAPVSTGEFASLANLFDEVIVDSFVIRYTFTPTTSGTAGSYMAIFAYDPIHSAALSSVLNGCQHEQHSLFAFNLPSQNTTACQMFVSHGFIEWHITCKLQSARNQNDATVFGHEWSDTGAASAAIYGFMKSFIPKQGALGVTQFAIIGQFNCRFRCRS